MATLIQMQSALTSLSGGTSLPGLDFDNIVRNIVETNPEYKTILDTYDGESRSNQKQKMIDYLSKPSSKAYIDSQISIIEINYSNLTSGLTQMQEGIISATASNAIPPAIATGIAPNPVYELIENKTKKNMLLTATDGLTLCLSNLIQSALNIYFVLPDEVLNMINILGALKNSIKQIPV